MTLIVNEHCVTGENPYWNPDDQSVLWTDIPNGKLFRYVIETGSHSQIYEGPQVGGFTMQNDGSLLLFRETDIAVRGSDGSVDSLLSFSVPGMSRFNDVIADPEGRVFAGTCGRHPDCGLHRLDPDGNITKLHAGTGISNGMGFSPDLKTFYWTDSTKRRIERFAYDRETGDLHNRSVFYQATSPEEGTPDGLAVDAEGCVWSARWGGYGIFRHAPDGSVLERIPLSVPKVTSVAFGGDFLSTLYITTATAGSPSPMEEEGALYATTTSTRGIPEFRSRILTEQP